MILKKINRQAPALFDNHKPAADLLVKFCCAYADFFHNDSELFRILMTYMLHPDQMNLSDELNHQIIQINNKSIKSFSKILEWGAQKNQFPAGINYKQSQYAIWRLLNGIISLYFFPGYLAKPKEKIFDTIKSALEIFVRGLKLA